MNILLYVLKLIYRTKFGGTMKNFERISKSEFLHFVKRNETLKLFDLEGEDLSNLDLSGKKFFQCRLRNTNFNNTDLVNCVFEECDLQFAKFYGADLDGVTCPKSNVKGTDLDDRLIALIDYAEAREALNSVSRANLIGSVCKKM